MMVNKQLGQHTCFVRRKLSIYNIHASVYSETVGVQLLSQTPFAFEYYDIANDDKTAFQILFALSFLVRYSREKFICHSNLVRLQ